MSNSLSGSYHGFLTLTPLVLRGSGSVSLPLPQPLLPLSLKASLSLIPFSPKNLILSDLTHIPPEDRANDAPENTTPTSGCPSFPKLLLPPFNPTNLF